MVLAVLEPSLNVMMIGVVVGGKVYTLEKDQIVCSGFKVTHIQEFIPERRGWALCLFNNCFLCIAMVTSRQAFTAQNQGNTVTGSDDGMHRQAAHPL